MPGDNEFTTIHEAATTRMKVFELHDRAATYQSKFLPRDALIRFTGKNTVHNIGQATHGHRFAIVQSPTIFNRFAIRGECDKFHDECGHKDHLWLRAGNSDVWSRMCATPIR